MKTKKRKVSSSSNEELPLSTISKHQPEEQNLYKSFNRCSRESCDFVDKVYKNRMKTKKRKDSSSSDEGLPLSTLSKYQSEDQNSFKSLNQCSREYCDFCDKVFKNRYSCYVHNATHIIIPLINQNVIECNVCYFCFTSQKEYDNHMLQKHTLVNGSSKQISETKDRNAVNSLKNLDNLKKKVKGNLSSVEPGDSALSTVMLDSDSDSDNVYEVPVCGGDSKMCNGSVDVDSNVELNGGEVKDVERYKAVHCDVLKMPKLVNCKHCRMWFPNRYNLIKHEASHMDIDKRLPYLCPICDWYISSTSDDIIRHMADPSHKVKAKNHPLKRCPSCLLYYRCLFHHRNNYHGESYKECQHPPFKVCDSCSKALEWWMGGDFKRVGFYESDTLSLPCCQCQGKFSKLIYVEKFT